MKFKELSFKDKEQIMQLEEDLYWKGEKWKRIWEKEGRNRFGQLINEYIEHFPDGSFGIYDEKDNLQGAIIFSKLHEIKPIPYFHRFRDYFAKDGKIAYVQLFIIERSKDEYGIAERLYNKAEEIAKEISCNKIAVVIYSSDIEEKTLKRLDYKCGKEFYNWEIYPGKFVNCKIYLKNI